MAHARDLYKTKLCTLYQRGNCPRHSCSFAHGEAELRRFPGGGGFNGRQEHHRSGDLRERLDRRGSPQHHRRSLSRDGRGLRQGNISDRRFSPRDRGRSLSRSPGRHRGSRSYSLPRSPSHKSDKRDPKKPRVELPDAHLSDVSGDHYGGEEEKLTGVDKVKSSAISPSPSPRDTLQEQLRQVQLDNEALVDEKGNLEKALLKKKEEASALSTQNSEVEAKLASSQEDFKRWSSKMKKLIKVYMRCTRAQEEVKKTQSKLQKMAEEFPTEEGHRPSALADDSDFYNLSDGEPECPTNGINAENPGVHRTKIDLELESKITGRNGISALNVPPLKDSDIEDARRKRLLAVREKTRASMRNMQQNGGNIIRSTLDEDHLGPTQTVRPNTVAATEKSGKVDMFLPVDVGSSKERRTGSEISPSLRSSPIDKVRSRDSRVNLPPTGLAAHARDFQQEVEEDVGNVGVVDRERVGLNLNMPPKSYQNEGDFFGNSHVSAQYTQYKDEDEDVDVEGMDTDMDERVEIEACSGEQAHNSD